MIRLLSDGSFHSGSSLGESLGISRAAVWKRLQALSRIGLSCQSVRGKGYRLSAPLDFLDAERLSASLVGRADVHYAFLSESTNSDALSGISACQVPQLYLAEGQLSGRGRRGRSWVSPFALNHYLSLRFPVQGGFSALSGLSLAVGVAISEVITAVDPAVPVQLKWPNDVQVNGAKLAGILVEVCGEGEEELEVVMGVGVNGCMPLAQGEMIDQAWTDLMSECRSVPNRTQLTLLLVEALLEMWEEFSEQGLAPFLPRYKAKDAIYNREVSVKSAQQESCGTARGVAPSGALQLETAAGLVLLHGGEVSVRVR